MADFETSGPDTQEPFGNGNSLLQFIDAIPCLVAYIDKDERYLINNRTYEEWFARPRFEFTGRHIRDVLGAETYLSVRRYVNTALKGEAVTFETYLNLAHDEPRRVQVTLAPHHNELGEVQGIFVTTQDYSDIEKARKCVAELEHRLDVVSELSNEFFYSYLVLPDGRMEVEWYWGSLGGRSFHLLEEAYSGSCWSDHVVEEDQSILQQRTQTLLAGRPSVDEFRIMRADGAISWIRVVGRPELDHRGKVIRITGAAYDITQSKMREMQLDA